MSSSLSTSSATVWTPIFCATWWMEAGLIHRVARQAEDEAAVDLDEIHLEAADAIESHGVAPETAQRGAAAAGPDLT